MQHYRLYWLDASDHIREAMPFEAEDDAAAIAKSEGLRDRRAMELWSGKRIVLRWSACSAPGGASDDQAAPSASDDKGFDRPGLQLPLSELSPERPRPDQAGTESSPSS